MREIIFGLVFALTFTPVNGEDAAVSKVVESLDLPVIEDILEPENSELPEIDKSTELTIYSSRYNKYRNNAYGYEIIIPGNLKLNEDIVSVKSRFESDTLN